GWAHSVETWYEGKLVGGVYGVAIGGFFAGESMFHTAPNASKVALAGLVGRLRERGFTLFDTQMTTPATIQMGATEIPRLEYLNRLGKAVQLPCRFN
ncbi:MAG: leucyl/phenylalanyl-tRNA--protein transferase, partial [Acidobacteria bacterium]|nr:leucyl/phenylalanyl-tRNA--protein transferase [Acidobacteriota bacterium]